MIAGVTLTPKRVIADERGNVRHMLKVTDPEFACFGEIYFSGVYPGAVKGWHLHKVMTLNYALVTGEVKLVLYDAREGSQTRGEVQEIFLGPHNYCVVKVPPGVWNGFKGLGSEPSIIANCASHPHDPDEIERCPPYSSRWIPYHWGRVDG